MLQPDSVVITGMGVMTPLGNSVPLLWEALLQQQSAIEVQDDLAEMGFKHVHAARVKQLDSLPENRGLELAKAAIQQAMWQAQLNLEDVKGVKLIIGTTMGESEAFESFAAGNSIPLEQYNGNGLAKRIATHFNLLPNTTCLGTACAAGNYAIGTAAWLLKEKIHDQIITGGVEPFSKTAHLGFSRSRAMSAVGCRPFDSSHDGMTLGEGAGFLVMELWETAAKRNALPLAAFQALGLSCDAYHPTAPNPDGFSMGRSITSALKLAKINIEDIGWVCLHGSGTEASDSAEWNTLRLIQKKEPLNYAGYKGAIGHSLGAASAIEAIICVQSLLHQIIPASAGLKEPFMVEKKMAPVITNIGFDKRYVLNSAYAFGGLNSALIIGKV
jgi:3-oxoacyl-[acyl-carrier-protein] synthase II